MFTHAALWRCAAAPAACTAACHSARTVPPQVYRGMLAPSYGGTEVAVKVQRPDVRRGVGLDLYLMHGLAHLLRKLPQACPQMGRGDSRPAYRVLASRNEL